MWILLIAFPFCTFAVILESAEECADFAHRSSIYWASTGQQAQAVCLATIEI